MKETIINKYNQATPAERKRMTAAALEYLAKRGWRVSRQALQYWRRNPMDRSPYARLYLQAYKHATQNLKQTDV